MENSIIPHLFSDLTKWMIFTLSAAFSGSVAYLHKLSDDKRFILSRFFINLCVSILIGLITQLLIEGIYPDMNIKLQLVSVLIIAISADNALNLLETRGSTLLSNFIDKIKNDK
jgi:small basic protein